MRNTRRAPRFFRSESDIRRWNHKKLAAIAGAMALMVAWACTLSSGSPAPLVPGSTGPSALSDAHAVGGLATTTPTPLPPPVPSSTTTSSPPVTGAPPPTTTPPVTATTAPAATSGSPYEDSPWWQTALCEEAGRDNPTFGYFGIYVSSWLAYGGGAFAPTAGGATFDEQVEIGMAIEGHPPDVGGCDGSW